MIIYFATIDNMNEAKRISKTLFSSIKNGLVHESEQLCKELLHTVDIETLVSLSEADWKDMIAKIRTTNPDFTADYIIMGDSLEILDKMSDALPSVLHKIIALAVRQKTGIIELPVDEVYDE